MSKHAMTRGWMDSEMWDEAPFTEREAWVWMIGEAAWKDRHMPINGKRVFLSRGQFSHSLRFMADKFKWSKKKVECYLEKLKIWDAIKTDNGTGQNIITICNYEKHQFLGDAEGDSEWDDRGTGRGQEGDKEEEIPKYLSKKEQDLSPRAEIPKPVPKAKEVFTPPDWIPSEAWTGFVEHRRKGKSPFTVRAQQLTVAELDKLRRSGNDPEAVLNQSVMRGWQGVFKIAQDFAQQQNTKGNENGQPARHANPALNAHIAQSDAFLEAGRRLSLQQRQHAGTPVGTPEIGDG